MRRLNRVSWINWSFGVQILTIVLLAACSSTPTIQPTMTNTPAPIETVPSPTEILTTSTPQPHQRIISYGPELSNFPADVNPLTGRMVSDVSLLNLPAVLVSISNMPVTARPQAGPGFASWVFELYIGEGATRFMNVFYGEYPRIVPNVIGGCPVRTQVIHPGNVWIGRRVWLDENANGMQDAWEFGVGGVCVELHNADGQLLETTSTDSNGYYSFNAEAGQRYYVQFGLSPYYRFTTPDVGNEETDSDVDPATGRTPIFSVDSSASSFDAGLILSNDAPVATQVIVPPNWFIPHVPYVGPIRSGRLTYNQIGDMFPNSCLVYASAAKDIGEMLNGCQIIYGVDKTTPNSALLTIQHMRELAQNNFNPKQPVNYSGNLFSETPPPGGQAANSLRIFYHTITQSGWQYDPVSQTYLRYTDQADGKGILQPATDRLTGRQMSFENVVVLFADYDRYRHNQFEVNLGFGQKGWAYLFRDGLMYKVQWSTLGQDWERSTGLRRPIYFVDAQNNPVPLRPGRTWIHLVTPYSSVTDQGNGSWLMEFVQPPDPLDTPTP